jgi:hypothetical protein
MCAATPYTAAVRAATSSARGFTSVAKHLEPAGSSVARSEMITPDPHLKKAEKQKKTKKQKIQP